MEHIECSETSAYKIQTPEYYPEESTQQKSDSLLYCWRYITGGYGLLVRCSFNYVVG